MEIGHDHCRISAFRVGVGDGFHPDEACIAASAVGEPCSARAALGTLDGPTLADIGFGPGTILSIARDVGVDRLRRPLHL
jgi:hypothetical protein